MQKNIPDGAKGMGARNSTELSRNAIDVTGRRGGFEGDYKRGRQEREGFRKEVEVQRDAEEPPVPPIRV